MQARRGFVLFSIGKRATGLGLIERRLFKMSCIVIGLRMNYKIQKKRKKTLRFVTPSGFKPETF
jgi:hypothetical protein